MNNAPKIAYNYSFEEQRREWAGEERRAPVATQSLPRLVVRKDRFLLVVLAVFVVVAALASVVL